MTNYKCSACKSRSNLIGKLESFAIIECPNCSLQEIHNKPLINTLSKIYEDRLLKKWSKINLEKVYKVFNNSRNNPKLDLFKRDVFYVQKRFNLDKINILEFGCGQGVLVNWSNLMGHNATGIESGFNMAKFLNQYKNTKVEFVENSKSLNSSENKFHLIYAEHSIEHVNDIESTIIKFNKIIMKNGFLSIRVPNHNCKKSKKEGIKWINYSPPHHLYFFSRRSLSNILINNGFSVIKTEEKAFFASGIWVFHTIDKFINKFIRITNRLTGLKISQLTQKNSYPRTLLDIIRLVPYFITPNTDEELYILARKN